MPVTAKTISSLRYGKHQTSNEPANKITNYKIQKVNSLRRTDVN